MLILLSPSKTQDFTSPAPKTAHSMPELLSDSETLVKELRKLSAPKLGELMEISDKLSALNYARYQEFHTPFTAKNARPALLAFKGDVYDGFDLSQYDKEDFAFAQKHLHILSGLYGLLRPLDLIQPYRLEMSIRLKNPRGKDLYAFWGGRITEAINAAKPKHIINLASLEYFKAVQPGKLKAPLVTPVFKEKKGNQLKIIGLFAKAARGVMADYIIRHRLKNPEALKEFSENGYRFREDLSKDGELVFVR